MADGVKREVRVTIRGGHLKWQFKRADEECWDYDHKPEAADWDALEDILTRRSGRGRDIEALELVHKLRAKKGI